MRKCKHYSVILFCGVLLTAKVAFAQFPVFDIPEFGPIMANVKNTIKTVKDLKSQLSSVNGALDSIGKEAKSLTKFSKGIKKSSGSAKSSANNASQTSQNGETTVTNSTSTITTAADETIADQGDIIENFVEQTEVIIEPKPTFVEPVADEPINNQDDIIEPIKPLTKPNTKPIIKPRPLLNDPELKPLEFIVEEEEEEEEINTNELEDEVRRLQEATLEEEKQIAAEFNDVLDEQLFILNKSAEANARALDELKQTIATMNKMSASDKAQIQEKIAQISKKQRQADEWAISIVEGVKENYNKEYNSTIKDGINNYTKVVITYLKGDVSKETVLKAGEALKKKTARINVKPDSGVLKELYQATASVRSDVENLAAEISKILDKPQES